MRVGLLRRFRHDRRHAVINLNREDGGRRKFILAEMGEHFNTAILPRVKKVIFSPEWREGKSSRRATAEEFARGPRMVKYMRIESYEDALANIRFAADGLATADLRPRYELDWESRESRTFLSEAGLDSPFSYSLELSGEKSRSETADLPETFAQLLGFRVRTRREYWDGKKRRYLVERGEASGRETAVIWRDVSGWSAKDYERDRLFVEREGLAAGADWILMNGDATLKGAESLNPIFAARMFPGEEEGE